MFTSLLLLLLVMIGRSRLMIHAFGILRSAAPPLRQGVQKQQRLRQRHLLLLGQTTDCSSWRMTTTRLLSSVGEAATREETYQELQWLSAEIRKHDALYYNDNNNSNNDTTTRISDDEYDALCQREAQICRDFPDLRVQLESSSGLGRQATRYGGRVGNIESTTNNNSVTTTKRPNQNIKRRHLHPMLSLDNIHDTTQLLAWLERIRKKMVSTTTRTVTILTEPKLDGVSLNLYYKRTTPSSHRQEDDDVVFDWQYATTRGDGRMGQNVTTAVDRLVPPRLQGLPASYGTQLEVRGEVVLPQSVFQQQQQQQQDAAVNNNETTTTKKMFSNARNAASGILLRSSRRLNETKSAAGTVEEDDGWRSKLCFYAYDLLVPTHVGLDLIDSRQRLQSLGFCVPQPTVTTTLTLPDDNHSNETAWTESDISHMLDYYQALRQHREDPLHDDDSSSANHPNHFQWGDYDMDGCVHKVSDFALRTALGNSNRAPRWAMAHKFPSTAAVTELLDVIVQVGRTGALTPVAFLKPVSLNGVSIQRATLHNFGHMRHILGGDCIARGTPVLVRRAGDVIPQVVSVVGEHEPTTDSKDSISLATPTQCPACKSDVLVEDKKTADEKSVGQVIRCGGPPLLCPPRAVSALQHAYSRDALDVSGLSEARIQHLMDADLLRLPGDVFLLDDSKIDAIAQLDGWGEKSARNLVASAHKVSTDGVSLARFIYSLGIRYAGVHSSAILASVYGTVDAFLNNLEEEQDLDVSQINYTSFEILRQEGEATKGIGPALLSSLAAFSKEEELVQAAKHLSQHLVVHADETSARTTVGQASSATTGDDKNPLRGLSVVFTGTLAGMSRSLAQETAKRMGAKATPARVSKATDLVVAGDKGGKKLEEAAKLGIRVMYASEFLELARPYTPASKT